MALRNRASNAIGAELPFLVAPSCSQSLPMKRRACAVVKIEYSLNRQRTLSDVSINRRCRNFRWPRRRRVPRELLQSNSYLVPCLSRDWTALRRQVCLPAA
jgi:hypothetical protein